MDYFVKSENMTVGYDNKPLIEDINIGVSRGEILTLVGPNGSGKSTILKSIIKQLRLIAGTVVLDGEDMKELSDNVIAKRMSIVMTERLHGELMTCREVVETGRYPYTGRLGILSSEDHAKVDDAIALVHAEDFAQNPYSQISDGQRQRLLLARAICQEPEIIVLDEPTSFLDIRHKLELLNILKRLVREKNMAVIMSLHELDLAEKISDRVVCVADGRVDRCGVPSEIFRDDYIKRLYGIDEGTYNAMFGCVEMEKVQGEPRIFVIGGGGSGIAVYRQLQRCGVAFAAGVIQENDLDYPVAAALAGKLTAEEAFSAVSDEKLREALEIMKKCDAVICAVEKFGSMNAGNAVLRDTAQEMGILCTLADIKRREYAICL